jgi:poly(hydroxyalkanoate) depolymerase family esterase
MNEDFGSAMRRAMLSMRASDVSEATRVIQEALARRSPTPERLPPASDIAPPPPRPRTRPFEIDPDADIVEPSAAGSPGPARPDTQPSQRWRTSLGETVRILREGRSSQGAAAFVPGMNLPGMGGRGAQPAVPEGARFEWREFASSAGRRRYRLYVPASASDRPKGLVVMLHGCKQNPDDFAVGTGMNAIAERHGLLVAYPEQTGANNASSCWNWFRPEDQKRDKGEPAIIAGIALEVMEVFGLERESVFVAGLSAGGAMAAVMGAAYPDIFSAVGVHSGLAVGSANDVVSAFAAMRGDPPGLRTKRTAPSGIATRVRTIVFHGAADRTVHPSNGERILATAIPPAGEANVRSDTGVGGGRTFARTLVADRGGASVAECWIVDGAGHAWSGGQLGGSYTDPNGPDASAEMVRFFLDDQRPI